MGCGIKRNMASSIRKFKKNDLEMEKVRIENF